MELPTLELPEEYSWKRVYSDSEDFMGIHHLKHGWVAWCYSHDGNGWTAAYYADAHELDVKREQNKRVLATGLSYEDALNTIRTAVLLGLHT